MFKAPDTSKNANGMIVLQIETIPVWVGLGWAGPIVIIRLCQPDSRVRSWA